MIYQTYVFKQATQGKKESIDEFHTRLRGLAKHCEFADADFEIKMQIVTPEWHFFEIKKESSTRSNIYFDTYVNRWTKIPNEFSASGYGIEEQFKTKPKENINTTTMVTSTKKKCYY